MIVPMKKTTLLCLASEKEKALEKLRNLGVMHVRQEKMIESPDRAELLNLHSEAERVFIFLETLEYESPIPVSGDVKEFCEKILVLMKKDEDAEKKLDSLKRHIEAIVPWGTFSPSQINELRDKGIFVYLCEMPEKQFADFRQRDYCVEIISSEKSKIRFAVISTEELDTSRLPLAQLPERPDLAEYRGKISELQKERQLIKAELQENAGTIDAIERYKNELKEQIEFAGNRDSMSDHEMIASLKGFVPLHETGKISQAARKYGWGLLIEDPAPDDIVPTLIKIPKIFRFIKPLFDFIGISPGYNEIDVSVCVLFFFTIFFGMIIGDAGYGSLFLIASIIAAFKLKGKKYRLPVRLFIVLSITTVIWGSLSGNWFGISTPGLKILTDEETKNESIQAFCFILAVTQLSIGRLWQAAISGKIRKALGQIGWAIILWGNFFLTMRLIVYPGEFPAIMYWLYGVGGAFVVFFFVDWRSPNEIFNFPFGIIGSFVDMLSYIRLFAVGMSGYYIASSFNGMGGDLMNVAPWLIPVAVLVILFGHILNILLCLMGVLVHGVRLNTLEFSNHAGLSWSGFEFRPFKKNNYIEGENENGNE